MMSFSFHYKLVCFTKLNTKLHNNYMKTLMESECQKIGDDIKKDDISASAFGKVRGNKAHEKYNKLLNQPFMNLKLIQLFQMTLMLMSGNFEMSEATFYSL